jgi:hypothetical protein
MEALYPRYTRINDALPMKTSKVRGVLMAAVLSVPVVILSSPPAHAITCMSQAAIDSNVTVRNSTPTVADGSATRTVRLRLFTQRISDRSYAVLSLQTRAGDRIWVERATSSSGPWERCATTVVPVNGQSIYSYYGVDNNYAWVRGCLDAWSDPRSAICTDPFYSEPGWF